MLSPVGEVYLTSWLCVSFFFSVKYERIKFLVVALKESIEIYAWAPKPYHKFMVFKVRTVVVSFLNTITIRLISKQSCLACKVFGGH